MIFCILQGSSSETYLQYAKDIRIEYSHIEFDTYCETRAKVLSNFLQKEDIYFTPKIVTDYDSKARENISNEIEKLNNKDI